MRKSIPFAVSAVCLLALAGRASGQGAATDLQPAAVRRTPLHTIAQLATQRPSDGTRRFTLYMRSPGDSAAALFGTMTVEQTTLGPTDRRVVRRVITYDYGAKGSVIDTTLSDAVTLAPFSERTHKPSGTIFLDFSGQVVHGRMVGADSVRMIDDTLAAPAFNSTDLELVVRSMPLRPGLRIALPIYDPEYGGFRHADVRVEEVETMPAARPGAEPRRAWVVRVRDTRLESVYRVDTVSRALLGSDIQVLPSGVSFRLVPAGNEPPAPRG